MPEKSGMDAAPCVALPGGASPAPPFAPRRASRPLRRQCHQQKEIALRVHAHLPLWFARSCRDAGAAGILSQKPRKRVHDTARSWLGASWGAGRLITMASDPPTFAMPPGFLGIGRRERDAAMTIAGIPLDIGTTNRSGARFGPRPSARQAICWSMARIQRCG